ncbi:MAG: signal recognition particle protein, partial [Candidatus Atribacteria bacterium]|nr:signal recognition particle protein [Candidatus Atribacteria bacterium]
YKVVKDFIAKIEELANQNDLSKSLTPGQQMIKITHEVLTTILGEKQSKLEIGNENPTNILLVGLQGSGKTTTASKLALQIKGKGYIPLLVAGDKIRPAATEQLQLMGQKAGVDVYSKEGNISLIEIIFEAEQIAKKNKNDVVIIDTAGRLHIDQDLIKEIKEVKEKINIHETLLVLDALMGQDALRVADTFNHEIGVDGYILTKLDGDARGGVALSIKTITNLPIKYVGVGEKVEDLEPFHPERMASRILGMGDTLTLIEKIESNYDKNELRNMGQKVYREQFNLNDFYKQIKKLKSMGSMEKIFDLMPFGNLGFTKGIDKEFNKGEKELKKIEAIICSMTLQEKSEPEMINGSRRRRIAKGSGTEVSDVNRLLKQFFKMKKILKQTTNKQSLISLFR